MTFALTKKTSKTRTRRRTTNWIKLSAKKLAARVQLQYHDGQAVGLSHFTKTDGTYNGRTVITIRTKKKNVTRI